MMEGSRNGKKELINWWWKDQEMYQLKNGLTDDGKFKKCIINKRNILTDGKFKKWTKEGSY